MEVEATETPTDHEIQVLQRCNSTIVSINTNLKATLTNLDHLSDSITRFVLCDQL